MGEFSKYETDIFISSSYCYKDTTILKNKLKLMNYEELKLAEERIVAIRQYELLSSPIRGHFTKKHLTTIHRYLFSDIYYFAGKIRKEQISKGDTMFYPPNAIDTALDKLFAEMQTFIKTNKFNILDRLAYFMAELNIIHPFREGNGRAIREFIRQLGLKYNINLNWGKMPHQKILELSILSVDDYTVLIDVLEQCVMN